MAHLSPSFSATLRVQLEDTPGSFARLASAIGDAGGLLGAIDLVRVERNRKVRDVTVSATDEDHLHRIAEAVRGLDGVDVLRVSDRTFLMHLGGKIEIRSKVPLKTRDDLSMAYASRRRSPTIPSRPGTSRSSRTPSPSSPTGARSSGSGTSGPRGRCP